MKLRFQFPAKSVTAKNVTAKSVTAKSVTEKSVTAKTVTAKRMTAKINEDCDSEECDSEELNIIYTAYTVSIIAVPILNNISHHKKIQKRNIYWSIITI